MHNNKKQPTPTQDRMLRVLSDGKPHTREELHACCGPSSRSNIKAHLSHLRKLLQTRGETVVCVWNGREPRYQWVRTLASPYDGRL